MPAHMSRVIGIVTSVSLLGALSVACGGGDSGGNNAGAGRGGGTGGSAGMAGGGSAGAAGNAGGGAGSAAGSGGSAGGSGGSAAGAPGGGAGGGGGSGMGGSGGGMGMAGAGGAAGSMDAGPTPDAGDAGPMRPARVLIYTRRSTPTHNASIPVAIASLRELFQGVAIEVEASEEVAMFTANNLARFGAVVMVNSNGTPFGNPGTSEGNALSDFVRAGGGLAAFHAAGNTSYPASHPLLALLGGVFDNTGGGVRNFECTPQGQHPVVAKVPTPLPAQMDETYVFGSLNPMNQVVLRCNPASGNMQLPGSWVREEGAGRVFYTTLGHGPGAWESDSTFLTTHAWPAILWVFGRASE